MTDANPGPLSTEELARIRRVGTTSLVRRLLDEHASFKNLNAQRFALLEESRQRVSALEAELAERTVDATAFAEERGKWKAAAFDNARDAREARSQLEQARRDVERLRGIARHGWESAKSLAIQYVLPRPGGRNATEAAANEALASLATPSALEPAAVEPRGWETAHADEREQLEHEAARRVRAPVPAASERVPALTHQQAVDACDGLLPAARQSSETWMLDDLRAYISERADADREHAAYRAKVERLCAAIDRMWMRGNPHAESGDAMHAARRALAEHAEGEVSRG